MNQSQFLGITCNSHEAREKYRVHGAIGLGFASHWLKNWRDSFQPITKRSNRNNVITFDSHLKTALNKKRQLTIKMRLSCHLLSNWCKLSSSLCGCSCLLCFVLFLLSFCFCLSFSFLQLLHVREQLQCYRFDGQSRFYKGFRRPSEHNRFSWRTIMLIVNLISISFRQILQVIKTQQTYCLELFLL